MAWSHLQSASNTVGSGNGTVTFGTNLSSGTKIICAIAVSASTAGTDDMTSVKLNDTAVTALTKLVAHGDAIDDTWVYLFAVDTPSDAVGTKPTVTATWNTASQANFGLTMLVQEVSGLLAGNTSAMLDGSAAVKDAVSTGPATTSAYSSNASNEYLCAIYGDPGDGVTVTNSSGYTPDPNNPAINSSANVFFDYENSGNTAESASFTLGGSAHWNTILVAFKLAASGPFTGPPFYPAVQPARAKFPQPPSNWRAGLIYGGLATMPLQGLQHQPRECGRVVRVRARVLEFRRPRAEPPRAAADRAPAELPGDHRSQLGVEERGSQQVRAFT